MAPDRVLAGTFAGLARNKRRLADFTEFRLPEMDRHGVDMQVLSLTSPGIQMQPDPQVAVADARTANDYLAAVVSGHAMQWSWTGNAGAVPYDPTIYLGSAVHYRYGRPAYSPELEAVLAQETGLDGNGTLLDVGCGPGMLTVRLAHLFGHAVGLDPDAGMLGEGRRAAKEDGVMNIRWVQGLAEDLPAVAPGSYRLVTFGQSFHWTTSSQWPRPSTTCWNPAVRTRFGLSQQFFVPGIPDLLRDSESVLSGYFSFSYSAPHLFGDRLDEFASEVRALLAKRSAKGIFWDWPGDTEVVIGRKPRPSCAAG